MSTEDPKLLPKFSPQGHMEAARTFDKAHLLGGVDGTADAGVLLGIDIEESLFLSQRCGTIASVKGVCTGKSRNSC